MPDDAPVPEDKAPFNLGTAARRLAATGWERFANARGALAGRDDSVAEARTKTKRAEAVRTAETKLNRSKDEAEAAKLKAIAAKNDALVEREKATTAEGLAKAALVRIISSADKVEKRVVVAPSIIDNASIEINGEEQKARDAAEATRKSAEIAKEAAEAASKAAEAAQEAADLIGTTEAKDKAAAAATAAGLAATAASLADSASRVASESRTSITSLPEQVLMQRERIVAAERAEVARKSTVRYKIARWFYPEPIIVDPEIAAKREELEIEKERAELGRVGLIEDAAIRDRDERRAAELTRKAAIHTALLDKRKKRWERWQAWYSGTVDWRGKPIGKLDPAKANTRAEAIAQAVHDRAIDAVKNPPPPRRLFSFLRSSQIFGNNGDAVERPVKALSRREIERQKAEQASEIEKAELQTMLSAIGTESKTNVAEILGRARAKGLRGEMLTEQDVKEIGTDLVMEQYRRANKECNLRGYGTLARSIAIAGFLVENGAAPLMALFVAFTIESSTVGALIGKSGMINYMTATFGTTIGTITKYGASGSAFALLMLLKSQRYAPIAAPLAIALGSSGAILTAFSDGAKALRQDFANFVIGLGTAFDIERFKIPSTEDAMRVLDGLKEKLASLESKLVAVKLEVAKLDAERARKIIQKSTATAEQIRLDPTLKPNELYPLSRLLGLTNPELRERDLSAEIGALKGSIINQQAAITATSTDHLKKFEFAGGVAGAGAISLLVGAVVLSIERSFKALQEINKKYQREIGNDVAQVREHRLKAMRMRTTNRTIRSIATSVQSEIVGAFLDGINNSTKTGLDKTKAATDTISHLRNPITAEKMARGILRQTRGEIGGGPDILFKLLSPREREGFVESASLLSMAKNIGLFVTFRRHKIQGPGIEPKVADWYPETKSDGSVEIIAPEKPGAAQTKPPLLLTYRAA